MAETMETAVRKSEKLGFSDQDTTELVESLNALLANYQVHYQKLRNFHWNIEGPDFFDLHENFENQYNRAAKQIDSIAERIRVFHHRPASTLREYLDMSEIEEVRGQMEGRDMVKELIRDFETLLRYNMDALDAANRLGDTSTSDMMIKFRRKMEKTYWMYTAWLKNHSA